MEQAIEGAEQVYRVKRGRPAKAKQNQPTTERTMADVIAEQDAMKGSGEVLNGVYYPPSPNEKAQCAYAQAYAMRVWDGQSVDIPPAERKERVFNALRGQNLPTDGIVFPA